LTRVHSSRQTPAHLNYLHLIALADRNDCPQAVAQLPTPILSKSVSAHAISCGALYFTGSLSIRQLPVTLQLPACYLAKSGRG